MNHLNFNHISARALSRRAVLKLSGVVASSAMFAGCSKWNLRLLPAVSTSTSVPMPTITPMPQATAEPTQVPTSPPELAVQSDQIRSMWVSYLEWENADFSSESAFSAYCTTMFDRCVALGLNTVMVQVRPFGDALYPSVLFPWSHVVTGTQGQAPDFDPLALMVQHAHDRALALEAWINPYRLRLNKEKPSFLAQTNLVVTHHEWVVAVEEGLYLNPAMPEVADYVCMGVQEILDQYEVDGIHFDDYFYPTTDDFIDDVQFKQSGETDRDAWRRANVSALVKRVYDLVKAHHPALRFGISPQGNPDNNYSQQYSDVTAWMNPAEGEACLDYVCPQVYWGYGYTLQSGSDRFAFENITAEWLAMPRKEGVALTFGLGAYRIGEGDGGSNEDSVSQWNSGCNLAAMIVDIGEMGADGYALYRYDSLFASTYAELATSEVANIESLR